MAFTELHTKTCQLYSVCVHPRISLPELPRLQHLHLSSHAPLERAVLSQSPLPIPRGQEEVALLLELDIKGFIFALHLQVGGDIAQEVGSVERHEDVGSEGELLPDGRYRESR